MLKALTASITYPTWVNYNPRFRRLDILDRLLDGKIYDHLAYDFYTERSASVDIPIKSRRPSNQFNMPNMIARWSSRKLFAGRHAPQLTYPDKKVQHRINSFAGACKMQRTLLKAAYLGAVGSVFVSFRVSGDQPEDNGYVPCAGLHSGIQDPELNLELSKPAKRLSKEVPITTFVWRSKFCYPAFDANDELTSVAICYTAPADEFVKMGYPRERLNPRSDYWFIRVFTVDHEVTCIPISDQEWDPVRGFVDEKRQLQSWQVFPHNFGFVPGHWFVNLACEDAIDGAATFENAIANTIDRDYLMSQAGRGVRYNCAPQLVLQGSLQGMEGGGDGDGDDLGGNDAEAAMPDDLMRSPTSVLHMAPGKKDADGNTMSPGDAKLLEMQGTGIDAALKLAQELRENALEQCSAPRKDPSTTKGPLSGRALEHMDENSVDLILELRDSYGIHGYLPLVRKILCATNLVPDIDYDEICLSWPRIYQPAPADVMQLVQAMALAVNPTQIQVRGPARPETPTSTTTTKSAGASNKNGQGDGAATENADTSTAATSSGTSGTTKVEGKQEAPIGMSDVLDFTGLALPTQYMLVTPEEARAYLKLNLDIVMLAEDGMDLEKAASAATKIDLLKAGGAGEGAPQPGNTDTGAKQLDLFGGAMTFPSYGSETIDA